ncbi:MAG TPA: hypothetical protein VMZ71_10840, partial [Gemmataceae bacterium]|nr:hypothetical protein [Gemmataceae bacterium]
MTRYALPCALALVVSPTLAAPPVAAVAYHPNGKLIAAGTQDVVRLFDAAGTPTGKIAGQIGRVTALAFASSGDWLAIATGEAGKSGVVRVYATTATDKPVATIDAHKDAVYAVAFSPDGKKLATAGYDRV